MRRRTRLLRRSPLLACLLGLGVLGGGWVAIGAAGGQPGSPVLTGEKVQMHRQAELPPLPDKLRARVVEPEAGATGVAAEAEPEQDPGLSDPGPKPTRAASTGGG